MSLDNQIKCIKGELARRKKIFPKLIENGNMTEELAFYEIETMSQALQTLTQIKGLVTRG